MDQHSPRTGQSPAPAAPITLRTIARMVRENEPFACLTCYDATTAKWLERAGVHVLLVGDTAAEVVLGLPSTVHMPLDVQIALTGGVKRGAPNTLVMGDMPFLSYHTSDADALTNAGRFLTEGHADIVKLEADRTFAPLVAQLTRAGIPVCAHVGARPQTAALTGGYTAAGRTLDAAERIVEDAVALEDAGAVMLLVEAVPPEVTQRIMDRTRVPLIGIGAGPAPHGQIAVLQDILGMNDRTPPFAPPLAALGDAIREAGESWTARVARRAASDHRYTMKLPDASRPPTEPKESVPASSSASVSGQSPASAAHTHTAS